MHTPPRSRVALLAALPFLAVVITGALAYRTVERVRIGSPEFGRVLLYDQMISNTIPAPATLSDPYLVTIGLATSTDAAAKSAQLTLLTKVRLGYDKSISTLTDELAAVEGSDADIVRATMAELAVRADAFWDLAESQFVPAVNAGDAGTALTLVLGPLNEAFQAHHDLGDRLYAELTTAQDNQEAATRRMIEHERNLDLALAAGLAVLLVAVAILVARRSTGRPTTAEATESVEPTAPASERVLVKA